MSSLGLREGCGDGVIFGGGMGDDWSSSAISIM